MNLSTAQTCARCGHQRWGTDRFCAGCGTAVEHTAAAALDLLELQPLEDPSAKNGQGRSKPMLRLGLLFAGLVLAVVVGVSLLSGDSASDAEVAETERRALDEQATGTGAGLEVPTAGVFVQELPAGATLVWPAPDVDGEQQDGQEQDGQEQDGEDLVATFDDVEGSLAFGGQFGTGIEFVELPDGNRVGFGQQLRVPRTVVSALGAASPRLTATDWDFMYWDGRSFPFQLALEESVAFIAEDPDVGVVLGITNDQSPVLNVEMLRPDTGERKPLEVSRGLQQRNAHLQFNQPGLTESLLFTNLGDVSYRWTWESGWVEFAPGFIDVFSPGWVITSDCGTPTSCDRHLVSKATGEVKHQLDPGVGQACCSTISPAGGHIATASWSPALSSSQSQGVLRVLDVEEDRFTDATFYGFNQAPVWVGEHHVALLSGFDFDGTLELFDVRTMESKEIDTGLAGSSGWSVQWIPPLPELTP